jgi:hypothetical protein
VVTLPKKEELLEKVSVTVGEKLDQFKGDLIEAIKQNPSAGQNPNAPSVVPAPSAVPAAGQREDRRAKKIRKERDEILDSLQDVAAALKDGDYDEAQDIVADVLDEYEEDGEDED